MKRLDCPFLFHSLVNLFPCVRAAIVSIYLSINRILALPLVQEQLTQCT